jgi:hypothetical protein
VPAGSVVRMERDIDLTAFMRLVATQYHIHLRRVVAADIDRDGDLDVVGATDRGFVVWVNDGAGRLTSQFPQQHPAVDGRAPADTWSGGAPRRDETIQNDLPSPRLPNPCAHAPPSMIVPHTASPDVVFNTDALRGTCAPRAPPTTT